MRVSAASDTGGERRSFVMSFCAPAEGGFTLVTAWSRECHATGSVRGQGDLSNPPDTGRAKTTTNDWDGGRERAFVVMEVGNEIFQISMYSLVNAIVQIACAQFASGFGTGI
ncbi:hypothetical protein GCM10009109_15160 [Marinobacterium sediminicola]